MEVAREGSEVKENEGKSGKRGGRRDGWKGEGWRENMRGSQETDVDGEGSESKENNGKPKKERRKKRWMKRDGRRK